MFILPREETLVGYQQHHVRYSVRTWEPGTDDQTHMLTGDAELLSETLRSKTGRGVFVKGNREEGLYRGSDTQKNHQCFHRLAVSISR